MQEGQACFTATAHKNTAAQHENRKGEDNADLGLFILPALRGQVRNLQGQFSCWVLTLDSVASKDIGERPLGDLMPILILVCIEQVPAHHMRPVTCSSLNAIVLKVI